MLPNADRAYIDLRKLADYVLSPDHPRGKHKAKVFATALGLGPADAEWLRDEIQKGVRTAKEVPGPSDEHGKRYVVDLPMTTASGSAVVRTAWIVRAGEAFPRLASCYVL
ncbi:MAG TPA: hypothetical protein EYQ24_14920 [Bacteroidetes bacterium]|nr:hypothetical protein [Bacteroidota bacterium]